MTVQNGSKDFLQSHDDNAASSHDKPIGLYTITCLANGRMYIGSSSDVMNRIYGHKSRLRSGVHQVTELQADFERYGEWQFTFSIQELCNDIELAVALEMVAVLRAKNTKALYNKILPRNIAPSLPASPSISVDCGNVDLCVARIRQFRLEHGLNKFALANLAGIPEGSTRSMDDPDWNPTVKTLQKLEAVIPKDYQPSLSVAA
jgi:predicted GIY-YIG superfamily endonuclease